MLLQQVLDFLLDSLEQRADFFVDDLRGMLAEIALLGHFPAEKYMLFAAAKSDRTDFFRSYPSVSPCV